MPYHCAIARLLVLGLLPQPATAWNALGHKVIAEIAWRQLEAPARQQIVDVLRRHPRFDADFAAKMTDDVLRGDKSVQDRWIFQHAATWPDLARGLPAGERGKYDHPTWHYINLPLYLDPSARTRLGRLEANTSFTYPTDLDQSKWNVIQAIKHCLATLKDRQSSAPEKAVAYCWLFHLVGDMHQPLHSVSLYSVGQYPQGDRGGNSIPLSRGGNLHSLWDGLLGRRHFMGDVDQEVSELSNREIYGDVWDSAAQETDHRQWLTESRDLAESFVYDDAILQAVRETPSGPVVGRINLPNAYYEEAGRQARRRIIAAGLRLGVLLRKIAESFGG